MAPNDRAVRAARFRVKTLLSVMAMVAVALCILQRDWRTAGLVVVGYVALLAFYYFRGRKNPNA